MPLQAPNARFNRRRCGNCKKAKEVENTDYPEEGGVFQLNCSDKEFKVPNYYCCEKYEERD